MNNVLKSYDIADLKLGKAFLSVVLAAVLMTGTTLGSAALAEPSSGEGTSEQKNESNTSLGESSEKANEEEASEEEEGSKEEVVYANLATSGSVDQVYVVNEFSFKSAGTLVDYGNYQSVSNLTNVDTLNHDGEQVSIDVDPGSFYYEGTLTSTDLPWEFAIEYFLDGKKLDASQVAGKSGELEIRITSKQHKGIDATFFENYLLQITTTLDSENCLDIESEGATIANAGKNKSIVHTVMPGKTAEISIKAQVKDFEMEGIQIAGMPYTVSFDMPDTDGMVGDMDALTSAISELNKGVAQLSSGTVTLAEGANQLVSGSSDFNKGLATLSSGSKPLTDGSAAVNGGLSTIVSELENTDTDFDLSSLAQLPQSLRDASAGLTAISESLSYLNTNYAAAYYALDASIAAIPATSVDASGLYGLAQSAGDTAAEDTLDQLMDYYSAAQTVQMTYYGPSGTDGAQAALYGVIPTLDTLTDATSTNSLDGLSSGLSQMADGIEIALQDQDLSGLQDLLVGLKELSSQYQVFHDGLVGYTGGVDTAAASYSGLHSGLTALSGGIGDLSAGTQELSVGASQLNEATMDLPEEMRAEIDEMMGEYSSKDFEPVSFTSEKNKTVTLVQFVITSESIAKDKEPTAETPQEESASFWDQVLGLFS